MIDAFEIIDILRNYCILNDIFFIPGNDAYVNAVADQSLYETNDLILIADFTASPKFATGTGVIVSNSYNGVLALGRKSELDNTISPVPEEETVSTLDETFEQKYDRRLKFLANKLTAIIGDIICENEMDILNCQFRLDINRFDLNADFVAAVITIEK